ncbi:hypothetical protein D3C80_1462510 [compost metagenome]
MLLVEQGAVLLAHQAAGQLGRTGVVAQLAVGVQALDDAQVVSGHGRQVIAIPQAGDTFQVLAGTSCLVALQVVQAEPCVGIDVGERLLLARHQGDEAGQHDMFEDVGVVAGVEGVTIVHGNSCGGGKFTLPCRRSQAWLLIGDGIFAGKPAPTGPAQISDPVEYLWERASPRRKQHRISRYYLSA